MAFRTVLLGHTRRATAAVLCATAGLSCAAPATTPTSMDDRAKTAPHIESDTALSDPAPLVAPAAQTPDGAGSVDLSQPARPLSIVDAASGSDRVSADLSPTDTAPPAIACSAARLCDDFEAYPAGGKPGGNWTTSGGGRLTVDSTRAFSGTKSIAIKLPGTAGAQAFMSPTNKGLFPLRDNVMYGRMMVYLPTSPGPGDRHWDMVIASGPLPTGERGNYMFGGYTEKFWPSYQPHHCWKDSKSPFIFGKWFCMQWQFDGSKVTEDARKNQMSFAIDGIAHPDISVDRFGSGCTTGKWEWISPTFDAVRFGYIQYQASVAPIEIWIDDVAVGDTPIACPSKP